MILNISKQGFGRRRM